MQLKYIVATIASLAVSSAIAGPVAEPAGNEVANPHLVARNEAAKHVQEMHAKFGDQLLAAWKNNYEGKPDAQIPTLEDIEQLAAQKDKQQSVDKRWIFSYNNQYCRRKGWKKGWQLHYPFAAYAHYFRYRLEDYYLCLDAYPDLRELDWDDECDDDYAYC